jgi:dihydroxy-acid dehydratase
LIAFIEDGDIISIDLPARLLELKVPEAEINKRRVGWQAS